MLLKCKTRKDCVIGRSYCWGLLRSHVRRMVRANMEVSMRYLIIMMVMLLTCLDLHTAQAATEEERESLEGLSEVEVFIGAIGSDARADGVSEEAIRTAVERILSSSGIPLFTKSEGRKALLEPYLSVKADTQWSETLSVYVIGLEIELYQAISLFQRPEHKMFAGTWEKASIGTASRDKLSRFVVSNIETLVKEFANDFLTANRR